MYVKFLQFCYDEQTIPKRLLLQYVTQELFKISTIYYTLHTILWMLLVN